MKENIIFTLGCIIIFAAFGLFACHETKMNEKVVLESKIVEIQFVRVASPPKHFHIDFMDLDLNEPKKHYFVSKHFNAWRDIPKNARFHATREKIKYINRENQPEHYVYYGIHEGLLNAIR